MNEEEVDLTKIDANLLLFATHLPQVNDMTLIILKGHLIIEECLINILENSVPYPKAFDEIRLSFFDRLCLVKALKYREENSWIWELIKKINGVRNDLAHKLELSKLDKKIEEIFWFVKEKVPIKLAMNEENESIESRLRGVFAFLCGVLSRY